MRTKKKKNKYGEKHWIFLANQWSTGILFIMIGSMELGWKNFGIFCSLIIYVIALCIYLWSCEHL